MELMELVPFIVIAVVIIGMVNRKKIKNWLAGRKDKE